MVALRQRRNGKILDDFCIIKAEIVHPIPIDVDNDEGFPTVPPAKGGTFKGDVYVECNNFELVDATIDGNVYFKTQEAKDTFKMDDTSKVTGTMEVQK